MEFEHEKELRKAEAAKQKTEMEKSVELSMSLYLLISVILFWLSIDIVFIR